MKLSKFSATGNDFWITDLDPSKLSKELVQSICDRRFGLGADGVLSSFNHRWTFFNADGSEANFCGNGARALALFDAISIGEDLRSEVSMDRNTRAGAVHAVVYPGGQVVRLNFHRNWVNSFDPNQHQLTILGNRLPKEWSHSISYINAGVPHACISVDSQTLMRVPVDLTLQIHSELGESDLNLTFYTKSGDDVKAITHERGIFGPTYACGSGALSVAFVTQPQGKSRITMPGGTLAIDYSSDHISLEGHATWIGDLSKTKWEIP